MVLPLTDVTCVVKKTSHKHQQKRQQEVSTSSRAISRRLSAFLPCLAARWCRSSIIIGRSRPSKPSKRCWKTSRRCRLDRVVGVELATRPPSKKPNTSLQTWTWKRGTVRVVKLEAEEETLLWIGQFSRRVGQVQPGAKKLDAILVSRTKKWLDLWRKRMAVRWTRTSSACRWVWNLRANSRLNSSRRAWWQSKRKGKIRRSSRQMAKWCKSCCRSVQKGALEMTLAWLIGLWRWAFASSKRTKLRCH